MAAVAFPGPDGVIPRAPPHLSPAVEQRLQALLAARAVRINAQQDLAQAEAVESARREEVLDLLCPVRVGQAVDAGDGTSLWVQRRDLFIEDGKSMRWELVGDRVRHGRQERSCGAVLTQEQYEAVHAASVRRTPVPATATVRAAAGETVKTAAGVEHAVIGAAMTVRTDAAAKNAAGAKKTAAAAGAIPGHAIPVQVMPVQVRTARRAPLLAPSRLPRPAGVSSRSVTFTSKPTSRP